MIKSSAGLRRSLVALTAILMTGKMAQAEAQSVTNEVTVTNYVTVVVTNVVTVMVTNVVPAIVAVPAPAAAPAKEEAKAEVKPKSTWTVSASAGLTLTKGNSDTALFTAKVLADQKTEHHELSLDADGGYGEASGTENVNFYHGFAQYNESLDGGRFYLYGRVEGLHDQIAAVDYRISLSPGAGYYLIKSARTEFSIEAGPSYVMQQLAGVDDCYASLRVANNFKYKINDHVRIWENWEYLPDLSDFNRYVTDGEVGVDVGMTRKSDLQVYLDDSYESEPAAGRKNNDLKLVSAFAYKF